MCWWREWVGVLNRMVRKCLTEQVTSVQRYEGGKGVSHGDSWEEHREQTTSERSLGGSMLGVLNKQQKKTV